MQKMLLAATALACVLSPVTSEKVEAAVAIPTLADTSLTSIVPVGEWRRKHRNYWPFWEHRRHRGYDYDRRYDGFRGDGERSRRDYGDRGPSHEGYRSRRNSDF